MAHSSCARSACRERARGRAVWAWASAGAGPSAGRPCVAPWGAGPSDRSHPAQAASTVSAAARTAELQAGARRSRPTTSSSASAPATAWTWPRHSTRREPTSPVAHVSSLRPCSAYSRAASRSTTMPTPDAAPALTWHYAPVLDQRGEDGGLGRGCRRLRPWWKVTPSRKRKVQVRAWASGLFVRGERAGRFAAAGCTGAAAAPVQPVSSQDAPSAAALAAPAARSDRRPASCGGSATRPRTPSPGPRCPAWTSCTSPGPSGPPSRCPGR